MCTLSIQDGKTISYDYIINRTINDMEKLKNKNNSNWYYLSRTRINNIFLYESNLIKN